MIGYLEKQIEYQILYLWVLSKILNITYSKNDIENSNYLYI